MPSKAKATGATKRKISVTVQAAIVTAIGTIVVALITGFFSLAQMSNTTLPTNTPIVFPSITPLPASMTAQVTPQNIKVLIDIRHTPNCECSGDFSLINIDGITFTKSSTDEFTIDTLKPYDILILGFSGYEFWLQNGYTVKEFTPNEILAIQYYLEQGGSVFMVSTSWMWKQYDKKEMDDFPLNLIAKNYGITFSASPSQCDKDEKKVIIRDPLFNVKSPITKDIHIIASADDAEPAFLTIEQPALRIASCSISTNPILASSQSGKGKIVALAHPNFVLKNLNDQNYDNYKLLKNVLVWLALE